MKKRIISVLLVTIMVGTIISICGLSFAQASASKESFYYQLGELEREYIEKSANSTNNDTVIKGNDFTISSLEFEYYKNRNELSNSFATSSFDVSSSDSARDYLVERETIYAKGLKSGITISDSELEEYIQKQVDAFNSVEADENIKLFLDGLGMTWEEYWNSHAQVEVLKRDLVNSKYKNSLREQIAKEEGIKINLSEEYCVTEDGVANNGLNAQEYQKIEEKLDKEVNKIVKSESVKYFEN